MENGKNMSGRWKSRLPHIGGVAGVIILVILIAYWVILSAPKSQVSLTPVDTRPDVKVITVEPSTYPVTIESFGQLISAPSTTIAMQVDGKIAALHSHFFNGGIVRAGEILVTLDPFDAEIRLIQAEAAVASAQAQLEQAKASNYVAQQELATAEAKYQTDLALRKPQLKAAEAGLKAAKAALKLAKKELDRTVYRAPFDGLIDELAVGLGEVINQGQLLGRILPLSHAYIHVPLRHDELALLPTLPSTEVDLLLQNGETRKATALKLLGKRDKVSRSAYLVVKVEDPQGVNSPLTPIEFGQSMQVRVAGKALEGVLKVANHTIQDGTVWFVDNTQHLQQVKAHILYQTEAYSLLKNPAVSSQLVEQLPVLPMDNMPVKAMPSAQLAQGVKQWQ